MKQCIAVTKVKAQCQRPASPSCGRYCKNHFRTLSESDQSSELSRSNLKNGLQELRRKLLAAGRGTLEVGGAVALAKELWDIFGPIMMFGSEQRRFQILLDPKADTFEQRKVCESLIVSLTALPVYEFEWVYENADYEDER